MRSLGSRTSLLAIAAIASLGLAGCVGSATTSSCVDGECTVTLQGEGASLEFGPDDRVATLESVDADQDLASFSIDGETVQCTTAVVVDVAGTQATCTEIADGRLVLDVAA